VADLDIANPPAPKWRDTRFEPFDDRPMPGTEQPCGCHLRNGDYEAILCAGHLGELNPRTRDGADRG
jgi:hypothetical protein